MAWDVHIQWGTDPAADFEKVLAADWDELADKGVPTQDSLVDDQPGFIVQLMVQGRWALGDHCCVEELPDGRLRMCSWADVLFADGSPGALVLTMSHEIVTATRVWFPKPGTRCTHTVKGPLVIEERYSNAANKPAKPSHGTGGATIYRPNSDFAMPPLSKQRHGILLPKTLWDKHLEAGLPDWTP